MTEIMGTIPGWITAGSMVTLLGIVLRNQVANRKLGIERQAVDNADIADVRDHYAQEVQQLRSALDKQAERHRADYAAMEERYQALLKHSDEQHRECIDDREKLRNEVGILRSEIDGLVRVIAQASIDRVIALGDDVPEHIRDAAARAQNFIKQQETRS